MGAEVIGSDGRIKDRTGIAPQGVVAKVYRSANVSLADQSVISLDTKEFDALNWFDTTTYRFTPKVAGYYEVSFNLQFGTPVDGQFLGVVIRKNGNNNGTVYNQYANSANSISVTGTNINFLNGTTDYIDLVYTGSQARNLNGTFSTFPNSWATFKLIGVTAGVVPEPWHNVGSTGEPAFINGWNNLNAANALCGFFKDPSGMVHLKGMITSGSTAFPFVLPPGYRPGWDAARFPIQHDTGTALAQVYSDGTINLGVTKVGGGWIALEVIHFRAEK